MYKRNKRLTLRQVDVNLLFICDDLLKYNDDGMFAILKKYYETTEKVIVSNIPLENLHIPSEYKITDNEILTLFDDETVLATLII